MMRSGTPRRYSAVGRPARRALLVARGFGRSRCPRSGQPPDSRARRPPRERDNATRARTVDRLLCPRRVAGRVGSSPSERFPRAKRRKRSTTSWFRPRRARRRRSVAEPRPQATRRRETQLSSPPLRYSRGLPRRVDHEWCRRTGQGLGGVDGGQSQRPTEVWAIRSLPASQWVGRSTRR